MLCFIPWNFSRTCAQERQRKNRAKIEELATADNPAAFKAAFRSRRRSVPMIGEVGAPPPFELLIPGVLRFENYVSLAERLFCRVSAT
jgi:hypothetical protein